MKKVITKTALAVGLTAIMGMVSSSAMATVFNSFSVNEASVPGALANPALLGNTVGKITGNYTEIATFTPTSATTGTFTHIVIHIYFRQALLEPELAFFTKFRLKIRQKPGCLA